MAATARDGVISDEQMDRATWPAVVRAYRIAEEALGRIAERTGAGRDPGVAAQALKDMRAEVEACQG